MADAAAVVTLLEGDRLQATRRWSLGGKITAGPFVRGTGGKQGFGCVVGKKRLVWLDPSKDEPAWEYTFVGQVVGQPELVDGLLVVADMAGTITALDPATGRPQGDGYRLKANVAPSATPLPFGPGRVWLPLADGTGIVLPLEMLRKSDDVPRHRNRRHEAAARASAAATASCAGCGAATWMSRAGPRASAGRSSPAVPELLAQAGLERSQAARRRHRLRRPGRRRHADGHQVAPDRGLGRLPAGRLGRRTSSGWPAVLGNDADVAGLAEALFGAGKGLSPIFYITIGSGIGGGLIIDGEIYRGCGRGAAEIGHVAWDKH